MSKNEVDISQVPEVLELVDVMQRQEQFRAANQAFYTHHDALNEEYNAKLQAAIERCRSAGISCGPIQQKSVQTKYDWDAAYEILGREAFMQLTGGQIETVSKKTGDKARTAMAISTGQITPEQAAVIRKITPTYSTPKPKT